MPNSSERERGNQIIEINELYEFAEALDIEVDEFPMLSVSSQSQMEYDGACHIALDARRFSTGAEEKVALAHELGHCITGSFYNRYSPRDIRGRHEHRANKSAAQMLVPLEELFRALKSPWNSVYDLAEHFGVTEDFMRKSIEIYKDELQTQHT